ncbi:hypothetical protein [Kutzneria chonburiensis]|uniref:Integral membrane protein n=1 Tax=Kutzneria chonburiensis TaxID=1483604 RepID=A0ABV6MU81_9PSEU|nr:hypothetical protein [Kutzneria chonburiensis]
MTATRVESPPSASPDLLEPVRPRRTAPLSWWHRLSTAWREALWAFLLSRVMLVFITFVATSKGGPGGFQCLSQPVDCVKTWRHFDVGYYLQIAAHGYWDPHLPARWAADGSRFNGEYPEAVAFFPLWPKLLGWLSTPFGRTYWHAFYVGLALAAVLTLVTYWLLYKLISEQFDDRVARWTLFFFAFSPFAIFYASGYGEVLFLPLALLVFLFARRERWWLAGLCGLLAALTRPNAVLLVIVFAVALVRIYGFRGLFTPRDLGAKLKIVGAAALVPAGVGLYMAYLWVKWGEPLAFVRWQTDYWHRTTQWPWQPIVRAVDVVIHSTTIAGSNPTDSLWELVWIAVPLIAVALTWRRMPVEYSLFTTAVFLMTITVASPEGEPLLSITRHLAGAFPVAVAYGLLAGRNRPRQLLLVLSLAFFGLFTAYFVTGRWVA